MTEPVTTLSKLAAGTGAQNGDNLVTADAVSTTFLRAEMAIEDGREAGVPNDTPVWVVQILGNFVCRSCSSGRTRSHAAQSRIR